MRRQTHEIRECYDRPGSFHDRIQMQHLFTIRGYHVDCTPRATEDGQFAAQVTFTYIGYNPEASFKNLGTYETEESAV